MTTDHFPSVFIYPCWLCLTKRPKQCVSRAVEESSGGALTGSSLLSARSDQVALGPDSLKHPTAGPFRRFMSSK